MLFLKRSIQFKSNDIISQKLRASLGEFMESGISVFFFLRFFPHYQIPFIEETTGEQSSTCHTQ